MRLRRAGRVIALDPGDRVLLMRYDDGPPNGRHWATPGGGLNPGESYADGAARELAEETGWTGIQVGAQVFEQEIVMAYGREIVRQHECFFLARVGTACLGVVDVDGMHRSDRIAAWRWWALPEMENTAEVIWPAGLASLIRDIVQEPRSASRAP